MSYWDMTVEFKYVEDDSNIMSYWDMTVEFKYVEDDSNKTKCLNSLAK